MTGHDQTNHLEIAVVGMACRFPGAPDVEAFWHNLRHGIESLTRFSDAELVESGEPLALLRDPAYVPVRGVIDGIDRFDAAFFGFYPREAQVLDPQQRVFLECCWHALEDAGYAPNATGRLVGVFAGAGTRDYYDALVRDPAVAAVVDPFEMAWFAEKDHIATRVSYHLGLEGPSMAIQSACSTSLVAVHVACQSLLAGECDLALAGGVAISVPQRIGYLAVEGGILSPDGHCRAFDARARGTVGADGAGVVVLKRLEDALADGDDIRAIIRGSAVNNDGARKVGFTAPSVDGQAQAMRAALAMAQVSPDTITFIEAHGTGTRLGDPIEVTALREAYGSSDRGPRCALGSVKTNIGHTDAAAGVAGLIKAVLALQHGEIPPTLHFESPNPELQIERSRFHVNATLTPWNPATGIRRAAVNSIGIGGTNAHVILQQGFDRPAPGASRRPQLLTLSARTSSALSHARHGLAAHLGVRATIDLADTAYTLHVGRAAFPHRLALVAETPAAACDALAADGDPRVITATAADGASVVFMFPGGGAQYVDMGRDLYRDEPPFHDAVDRCAGLAAAQLGVDLRASLFRGEPGGKQAAGVDSNSIFPVALFVIENALADLYTSWGIEPAAMIGHSLGEYVAAYRAGVFSLEDALALIALRGRLFERLPRGAMTSVPLGVAALEPELTGGLTIAAINAPEISVVSGRVDAVELLEQRLAARGLSCKRINLDIAAHSPDLDAVTDELYRFVSGRRLAAPKIPIVSNVTGSWLTPQQATDPAYWAAHLRRTVRFSDGIRTLSRDGQRLFLEVGPGWALSSLARAHRDGEHRVQAFQCLPHPSDDTSDTHFALATLGKLWAAGARIDWRAFHAGQHRRRTPLPMYPFERKRYWIDARRPSSATEGPGLGAPAPAFVAEVMDSATDHGDEIELPCTEDERVIAEIWETYFGIHRIGRDTDFFDLGGTSLLATRVLFALQERLGAQLTLRHLIQASTVRRLAEAVAEMRSVDARTLIRDIGPVDESDLQLGFDILCRDEGRATSGGPVLLTGATGYLGAHLLEALLRRTSAPVYCLVRASSDAEVFRRITDTLAQYRLAPEAAAARIIPLAGSLELPLLGLSGARFEALAHELGAIYHCGALVHFTYPYAKLEPANVGGTREVLRLASHRRLIPVHHVSTTAVAAPARGRGAHVVTEADPLGEPGALDTGYAQSKWAAEKLVERARAQGMSIAIYRPGAVTGDTRTGICRADDALWRMIKGCIQLGFAPDLDEPIPNAPVDYVCDALVHISSLDSSAGKVFHLTSPTGTTWNDLFELTRRAGFALDRVPYRRWRTALDRVRSEAENSLFPLIHSLGREAPESTCSFDCSNTLDTLAASGIECGRFDDHRMRLYLDAFIAAGFLDAPVSSLRKGQHDHEK